MGATRTRRSRLDAHARFAVARARVIPDPVEARATMIEAFVAQLHANSCAVHHARPADALAVLADRVDALGVRRVAIASAGLTLETDELMANLRAHGVDVLAPDDAEWSERLAHVDAGITGARLAVAEPASIAIASGRGVPRSVSLVPPVHLCALRVTDVVATLGDALSSIAPDELPSALTWISGPSRTGDLEMVQTIGVHGPRHVEVVLIDDEET